MNYYYKGDPKGISHVQGNMLDRCMPCRAWWWQWWWPVIHTPDAASTWGVYYDREVKRQRDRGGGKARDSRGMHLMGGKQKRGEKREKWP